jgi:predicted Fe-Mo cluster-binding NifX family protein
VKIAVSAQGKSVEAAVDPRFGRCPYLVIVDTATMDAEGVDNPGALAGTGAGVAAAQIAADAGAEAIITGVVGPHAFEALSSGKIRAYGPAKGSVRDAVEQFQAGQLGELQQPNAPLHAGDRRHLT